MKKITLLFALLLASLVGNAQGTAWVNCKEVVENLSLGLEFDSGGNVIEVGYFTGTIDFNPLGSSTAYKVSNGLKDIYIAKYNTNGVLLWVYVIGGTGDEKANAISKDSNGDLIIVGQFTDSFDFDISSNNTTLTSSGSDDVFVLKMTTTGSFLWAKRAGGIQSDLGLEVETLGTNIYVAGLYASGIIDLFSNTNSACRGLNDVFLCGLSSTGSYLWSKTTGNSRNDVLGKISAFNNKIAICYSSTNFYSAFSGYDNLYDYGGTTQASITTSTGTTPTGVNTNGAVSIFDSATGNFDKFFKFQGENVNTVKLLVDSSNINFVVVGHFTNTIDLNPYSAVGNVQRSGISNAFVSYFKNDAPNTFLSAMTTINITNGSSINILDAEIKNTTTAGVSDIFLVGYFAGGINIDLSNSIQEINSPSVVSGHIVKYSLDASNATDKIKYEFAYANAKSQAVTNAVSVSNNVEISPIGNNDIAISGYIDSSTNNNNGVNFFPGNTPNPQTSSNGIARGFLQYIDNCFIDKTITQSGNTLTVAQTGATYQWYACGNSTPISGATQRTYTGTLGQDYIVVVNLGFCVAVSNCFSVLSIDDFSKLGVKLYPNPVKNSFTIEGETTIEKLVIYNLVGQQVKTFVNTNIYPIEDLTAGTYLVELTTEKGTAHTKIIKE